ncbi:N-acetyllactosaminide beta-1,3-N-acetylglucosaminyltransferase 3 [Nematostella vectensis]|uniref:N-acetyllactosaminide beta-1,3-N-acetylglucosaminyltransferase 3 n=1 Tax=Nematostella vectensis TaxID=45351 RepID=UPI001390233B|nr:N-acetyllactosaminide beta-1,3-N-acetylglucosaminyltransferase 3 [Nematostella vectensis]
MVPLRGCFTRILRCMTFTSAFNGRHRKQMFLLFLALVILCQVVLVTKVLYVRSESRSRQFNEKNSGALNTTPALLTTTKGTQNEDALSRGNFPKVIHLTPRRTRKKIMRLLPKKVRTTAISTSAFQPTINSSLLDINSSPNSSSILHVPPTLDTRILNQFWPPLNFTLVSPCIAPKIQESPYLLILINSAVHSSTNKDRRNAIRKTWANKRVQTDGFGLGAKHGFPFKVPVGRSFRLVFLLGRSYNETIDKEIEAESQQHNDLVVGDFPDNYVNLIIKVYMGFKWARENVKSRFILKGDDDTYIYLPRLTNILQSVPERFFGGYVMTNAQVYRDVNNKHGISKPFFGEDVYPPYCGGPFYVFTSNLLPDFIRLTYHFKPFHIEDAYMGILLRHMGIRPVFIPGFLLNDWMPGNIRNFKACDWATAIAVGHKLEGELIEYIHSKLPIVDPSRLTSQEWQRCHRRSSPRSDNVLSAVYGILISLSMILVYVTVAFLPSNQDVYDERPFFNRRQHYYPYIPRAGR